MLSPNLRHSKECPFWPIPESAGIAAPRFPFGLFVPLGDWYQVEQNITFYGQIRGISWNEYLDQWFYEVHPPSWHCRVDDLEVISEEELSQRLIAMTV